MTHQPAIPPRLGEPGTDRLPSRALTYLNLTDAALGIAVSGTLALLGLTLLDGVWRTIVFVLAAAVIMSTFVLDIPVLNRLTVRFTSFTVTSDWVYLSRGALFRRAMIIPAHQVLNVETVEGPLLQRLDLAKIRFTSIAGSETFGPLTPESVNHIREVVATQERLGGTRRGN